MLILTEKAELHCAHELGIVDIQRSQSLVTIEHRAMLVATDPENRKIDGCPLPTTPVSWPCPLTLKATAGYSGLLRIDGRRVCLQSVVGLTAGGPPGTFTYHVHDAGQHFVRQS